MIKNNQRLGSKEDILLKKSLFLSNNLMLNIFTLPTCKRIRIIFPLYEKTSSFRSKSVIILLEFLEQITGLKAIIKKANIIVGSGLWVRGQIDLSGFNLMKFFLFFNEYILSHPLLRFSSKLPFLRLQNKNTVKVILSNIDFFFDTSTKRSLPHASHYWLEFSFFFDNKFKLKKKTSILFYIQYFLNNNTVECLKI
jgi:hypothetical protein